MKALLTFMMLELACTANAQHKNNVINVKDTLVYQFAEFPAEYPGGDTKMVKYIMEKLPIPAHPQSFDSRHAATFVVEKNGTLSHIKIIRPSDQAQALSFLKVISGMPKWLPAVNKGYIVRAPGSISMTIEMTSE